MNKIYKDEGSFNFIYQLPKIIYSSMTSILINSIIKFLSLTEESVVKIKEEKKKNSKSFNEEKIKKLYKTLKIKFVIFFIVTFIFLVMFWFYITCFCGVYKNTQIHIIKDSFLSLVMSLLYPFVTFLLPGIFRILALSAEQKDKNILYKFSQLLENI